jgi:hydroxymethylglutaryl-CoA lyase
VPVASVVDVVERFAALGCDEIDIADTIGVGTPQRTREVFEAVTKVFPRERLSGHFHDTYGQALANIYAALQEGIAIFHASVAGLGGCPYAKGATGNVATEDVLYLMNGLGIHTGVDLNQVVAAGDFISTAIGRANVSRAGKALLAKQRSESACA